MTGLIHRLRARPPSPPVVYEWLAQHWPEIMFSSWGPVVFGVVGMIILSYGLPFLVLTILGLVIGTVKAAAVAMLVVCFTSPIVFWLFWKPLGNLWTWYPVGAHGLREIFLRQLDDPRGPLALQVSWMLENKPGLATALARQMSRRHNRELRPADVIWLGEQTRDGLTPEYVAHSFPPTPRQQLEQWGLFAMAQGVALERVVDHAPNDPTPPKRF